MIFISSEMPELINNARLDCGDESRKDDRCAFREGIDPGAYYGIIDKGIVKR